MIAHAQKPDCLSAKRTSPFKPVVESVQSTTGSRGVHISGSNAGYIMFLGSVKGTGYPPNSPVSPSLPLPTSPCAITFHLESTGCEWSPYHALASECPWEETDPTSDSVREFSAKSVPSMGFESLFLRRPARDTRNAKSMFA